MNNNGFLTRAISGVVLLAIILLAGIIGGNILFFLTVFVSFVGLMELYKALGIYSKNTEKQNNNMLAYTGFIMTAVYFLVMAVGGILPPSMANAISFNFDNLFDTLMTVEFISTLTLIGRITWMLGYVVLSLVVLMGVYVFTFPKFDTKKVAYTLLGLIYVPVFMSFMYMTRTLTGGQMLIWLIFISSWICDTCAYLVGCSIGKHKLAPVLSPKKSIEGAVGGILGSIIVAFVYGYFVQYKLMGGVNNSVMYMIICGLGAVVSQIGDLAASAIKRNHDIKDYGTLIPGHGGIMDRFDSVIFVSPFIFILCIIIF